MFWWLVRCCPQVNLPVALKQLRAVNFFLQEAKVFSLLGGEVWWAQLLSPGFTELAATLLNDLEFLGQI